MRGEEELNARNLCAKVIKALGDALAREIKHQEKKWPREKTRRRKKGMTNTGSGKSGAGAIGDGAELKRSLLEQQLGAKIRKLHATPLVVNERVVA